MANDSSYRIHPEHDLKPMKPHDPFYRAACKEIGFGPGYGCPQCVVPIHKECMSPSPSMSLTIQKKEHSLKFYPDMKGENGKAGFCAVCFKLVHGYGYSSSWGDDFHPSCLPLPKTIMVNDAEVKLSGEMKLDCKWCGFRDIYVDKVKLSSWSCAGWKGEYHAGCVKDMMIERWRNGELVPAKEGNDAGRMHIKVDLPSRGEILGGRAGRLILRGTLAALNFDPTAFLS